MQDVTVQELMQKDLLDEGGNETVEVLNFIKNNDVALTEEQVRGILILNMLGFEREANYIINMRKYMATGDKFRRTIEKLTLADRIKGNAKLSQIMKANPNPVQTIQKDEK